MERLGSYLASVEYGNNQEMNLSLQGVCSKL